MFNALFDAFRNGSLRKGRLRRGVTAAVALAATLAVALCALASTARADTSAETMTFAGGVRWIDDGKDHSKDAEAPSLTLYRTTGTVPIQYGEGAKNPPTGFEAVPNVTPTWNTSRTTFEYAGLPM
jgi:hypothetical protein